MAEPKPSIWRQNWFLRRVMYAILAVGWCIAIATGFATPEQADGWAAQITQFVEILILPALGIAAVKANRASDSNATDDDVRRASEADARLNSALDVKEALHEIEHKLNEAPKIVQRETQEIKKKVDEVLSPQEKLLDLFSPVKMGANQTDGSIVSLDSLREQMANHNR